MRNTLIAAGFLIVLIGGGAYIYSTQGRSPADPVIPIVTVSTDTAAATSTSATSSVDAMVTSTKEFSITNKGFVFSQKELSIKKGDRVKITYTNGGGTHDFRIDGYNVGTQKLAADASETFEFVADKAGTFEFFCSVGNHRAMGMKGTLTVSE